MKRRPASTGLEGAPDIMLLTMAGLMVAVVWLAAHAQEKSLPPISLPASDAAAPAAPSDREVRVTLRPEGDRIGVWVEDRRIGGGLDALEEALVQSRARAVTLRADAGTRWDAVLTAMSAAARLELAVSVAANP